MRMLCAGKIGISNHAHLLQLSLYGRNRYRYRYRTDLGILVSPPEGEVGDLRPDELHLGKLLQFHHHQRENLMTNAVE